MLTAIIILSLLSLLVATEAEPTRSPVVPLRKSVRPEKPGKQPVQDNNGPKRDQMAA